MFLAKKKLLRIHAVWMKKNKTKRGFGGGKSLILERIPHTQSHRLTLVKKIEP